MTDDPNLPDVSELKSLSGQIHEICDRFEADWKSGRRPRIEDYLRGVPEAARGTLLHELLGVELRLRHRDDQQPTADEYRRRFPDYQEQVNATFAAPTRPDVTETLDHARDSSRRQPRALHIRCPHCRNPIELVDDTPMEEIACPSCGSGFHLAGDEALAYETVGGTTRRRRAFGHFELIEQLGVGAFGAVWRARDTQLDRTVALKIPRKGQLTREETEKMLREARAAAQLRHPSIVSVHEVGLEEGAIYIVSDFIEGVSLHDRLNAQRPTYREAAELCAKIADAVHFAHEHGVIHRDLKPLNVMLDPSGEPHVMDFGLAKREAGEITMTIDGEILGTPAYMPPEQAEGEAHQADRRSDVYSLGVILFELLTGEQPFRGNLRMLIHQVIHDEPPSPRKLDGHIPRDLETTCLKCLEKEPRRRYQSAQALSDELRRFLRGEPIQARPVGRLARGWRWCKRKPAVASLTGTVALLLLFLAVAGPVVAVREASLRALAAKRAEEVEQLSLRLDRMAAETSEAKSETERLRLQRKVDDERLRLQQKRNELSAVLRAPPFRLSESPIMIGD